MGKTIQFKLGDATAGVELEKKIHKEDLYGKITTLAEKDGQRLQKAYLLPDGRLILRSQLATAKTDGQGTPIEDPAYFLGEEILYPEESSFEVARDITPTTQEAITAFSCNDVYALSNPTLAEGIYSTSFSYRKGYRAWQDALIIVKPDARFLLIGTAHTLHFVGRSSSYSFFDAQDEGDEETDLLDFSSL